MRFRSLGKGSTVRESGMGNLNDLLDLLGCQLAHLFTKRLGRNVQAGQTQTSHIEGRLERLFDKVDGAQASMEKMRRDLDQAQQRIGLTLLR